MQIGLTYDLRSEYLAMGYSEEETAEFDRPDTIAAIENALRELGHQTERIGHARQLMAALTAGRRWHLVFNICEGLRGGAARESQVPAILDVYDIPYTFSDPLVTGICLHKGLTKLTVSAAGVPTPRSAVVESLADLAQIDLRYPLFAKPVAEGTGKGIDPTSKIIAPEQLRSVCARLLSTFRQPVLVEEFLPGREFTTGIIGTGPQAQVLGTLEIALRPQAEAEVYSYANKENCEELVTYTPTAPQDDPEVRRAEEIALTAWRALGCRDAGRVDLRSDAQGQPQFIEVNPLAGLHPWHSDLPMICTSQGIAYVQLIERIVRSASQRVRNG
jgi:D-alanine-D-alanine ligase